MRSFGAELLGYAICGVTIIVATIVGVIKDDKKIAKEIEELEQEGRRGTSGKILEKKDDNRSLKCPYCGAPLKTAYGRCEYCGYTYFEAKNLEIGSSKRKNKKN